MLLLNYDPASGGDTYADLHFAVFGIYETNVGMLKTGVLSAHASLFYSDEPISSGVPAGR